MKFNHLNVPDHWQHYWSRYPEGYTILEALINWVTQVDDMVDNQNKLNDNVAQFRTEIDAFVGRFDERLQDEVTQTLKEWQNSGFLEVIINAALDTKYHEMDERLSTQLTQKVGMGIKAELEDLSSNVIAAIEGGVGTSFNLLSIPQNNSVSEYKTTFIKNTRNLMNPNQLGEGFYTGSGEIQPHELYYHTTDFPKTNGVKKLSFQPNDTSVVSIVFYNAAKQFIGYATNNGDSSITTFDVPDGSYYFNVSFYKSRLDRFMIEYGETQSSYEPHYPPQLKSNLMTSLIDESKNLMNPSLLGNGYLGNVGEVNAHDLYRYTKNYIPTNGQRWLSFQPNSANRVINIQFYDSTRNFLAFDTNDLDKENIKRFEVPKKAHYFRISFNSGALDEFMVEYGLHQSEYEPYKKPTFIEPFNRVIEDKDEDDLTVVCFGDSITGAFSGVDNNRDYPLIMENKTGWKVTNVGFGGARMGPHPSARYDAFSMYRLADAVATGDWSRQTNNTTGAPNYAGQLQKLMSVDWHTVDIVTIAYGTNDWGGGLQPPAPIDNPDKPYDTSNVVGALRYSVKTLLEAYPHLKILVLTPVYRYDATSGTDSDDGWRPVDNPNYALQEYVDAILDTSNELKTPVINMYNSLGINKYNREDYFDGNDGVHPNSNGMRLIAGRLVGEINKFYS